MKGVWWRDEQESLHSHSYIFYYPRVKFRSQSERTGKEKSNIESPSHVDRK